MTQREVHADLLAEITALRDRLASLTRENTELQEQQTATSEILRAISSSPTDVQPVFDAVADSAARLCNSLDAYIFRRDGNLLRLVAHHGRIPIQSTLPLIRGTANGRAVLDGRTVHVVDMQAERDEFPEGSANARLMGHRTILNVPLIRDGIAIGTIGVRRTEAGLFSESQVALLQTFADQAVIAIENARLFTETKEALDRQTATSEILRVISESQTNLQPIFEAIVRSAAQLCEATFAVLHQFDGHLITFEVHHGMTEQEAEGSRQRFPLPIDRETAVGRAILDRRTTHIHDIRRDPEYRASAWQLSFRTVLAVPLLREGVPVGAIGLWRREVKPFPENQITLVETFADQAVIAIENVRLLKELEARNSDLMATSGILQVISRSLTDVQPVLDTVAESAARLCASPDVSIFLREAGQLRVAARHGSIPSDTMLPLTHDTGVGAAVLAGRTIQVADMQTEANRFPISVQNAQRLGFRTVLNVPLMREGVAIGAISLRRTEAQLFGEPQVSLLETFADQAVIAIENVRLFKELQASNQDIREALDTQTATSDILRVISSSPTDVTPVFDAICRSAVRLLGAHQGGVFRFDGKLVHIAALTSLNPEAEGRLRTRFPQTPNPHTGSGRAIVEKRVFQIPDTEDFSFEGQRATARDFGFRRSVWVPMIRDEQVIGVLSVNGREPGPYSEREIALLKTFADQAVIAIENVRLFTELQARTQELTRSVGQLTALGDVARAVSSTLDLEAVLNTIVSRAIQLSGTDGGSVYEYDEATEEFSLRASRDLPEAYIEQVRDTRPRKGEGAVGRVAQTREPVQIADISDPAAYESRVRNTLLQMGLRALLAVPLIAEDRLVGALIVMRKRTGTFATEEVALLQTFASQSALAIQNARLFREIEAKSRQLEVASQHKSEFLANMSHELRTPLNAIIGFSEVLTDRMFGELNEKQEEYLKDIYASGTHLLSLINDILDLSKIEAGRMELELTDFDLPTTLDNALMLVRERAGRRSLTLQMSIDEQLGEIRADERKIRQVVLNLLSNAIKFTPEGGRIEVGALPKDGFVEVSVSDTGVGIAPEDQEAVFEEFRQAGTAAKKVEGTGLGLTLCRKFVELHGGRIWVKSQEGEGSTFTFTIPVRHGE